MTWQQIDHIFPYLVFFYGIIMIFILENKFLDRLAQEKMPQVAQMWKQRKPLAWTCFFVGGLWSVQNLLFI